MVGASARWCAVLLACLTALIVLALAAGPAVASQADYDRGYGIGLEAYTYGLPLLVTNATYATMTSIDVSERCIRPGQPVQQRPQPERPQ